MRAIAIGLGVLALTAVAPAMAAEPEVSVETVQAAVVVYFGKTNQVTIANWRGTGSGANDWGMQRRITGAQTTQRCVTILQTPQVLFHAGAAAAAPAATYGIDWGKISDVSRQDKSVFFRAAHMAADENGELDFPTVEEAEQFEAVMSYLSNACRG